MVGTWVSSITGDNTFSFLGLEVYSVQFTCLMRGVALFIIGMVLVKKWRAFTPDADIVEIEKHEEARREAAKLRPPIDVQYVLRQLKRLVLRKA